MSGVPWGPGVASHELISELLLIERGRSPITYLARPAMNEHKAEAQRKPDCHWKRLSGLESNIVSAALFYNIKPCTGACEADEVHPVCEKGYIDILNTLGPAAGGRAHATLGDGHFSPQSLGGGRRMLPHSQLMLRCSARARCSFMTDRDAKHEPVGASSAKSAPKHQDSVAMKAEAIICRLPA